MTALKQRTVLILIIITALLTAIAAALFYYGWLRFNYVSFDEFPVQGLDVSHHQGKIDWEKVKNTGFKFVFIKATEGGSFVDPRFRYNRENAGKNGLIVGAYHYFTFRKTGAEQAKNFIATVPYDNTSLPPVVDLEFMGNSGNRLTRQALHRELSDFIGIVEKKYRKRPVLYSTYEFYDYYLAGAFKDHPLWIRDIFKRPGLIDKRNWTFWQYANRARVDGIPNYVDLNVFNGNEEKFTVFPGNRDWRARVQGH